jgi:hypothetical protein
MEKRAPSKKRCGFCHKEGHNIRSCKDCKTYKASKAAAEAEASKAHKGNESASNKTAPNKANPGPNKSAPNNANKKTRYSNLSYEELERLFNMFKQQYADSKRTYQPQKSKKIPEETEKNMIRQEFLTLQKKLNGNVKKAYHQMSMKYHPDKCAEKGHLQKWVNAIYNDIKI